MREKKNVTLLDLLARVLRAAESTPQRSRAHRDKLMRRAMKRYAGAVVSPPPVPERRRVAERRFRARVQKARRSLKASRQTLGATAAYEISLGLNRRVRKQRPATGTRVRQRDIHGSQTQDA